MEKQNNTVTVQQAKKKRRLPSKKVTAASLVAGLLSIVATLHFGVGAESELVQAAINTAAQLFGN